MRVTTPIRRGAALLIAAGMAAGVAYGQNWPQYMYVYCTFYDYKADQTNPNFQPAGLCESTYDKADQPPMNANGGVRPNMVLPNLGADRKPTINPANIHQYHNRLNDWFRPQGGTGATFNVTSDFRSVWTNLRPIDASRPNQLVGQNYNASDPMCNIVMYDSLRFTLQNAATGTYQYRNDAFFPLDSRGYGIQPTQQVCWWHDPNAANARHNFGFAMEIHRSFTYNTSLNFSFTGDDDVWCFVDGRLVMDIGGIHGPITRSVDLSSLGLVVGNTYTFDFFYCERNVLESHILITTNVISYPPPQSVNIFAFPDDTIWEGDSVRLWAEVTDENGNVQPSWAAGTRWVVESTYPNANQRLSVTQGAETKFQAIAGTGGYTFRIIGTACNPDAPNMCKSDSVVIVVRRPELVSLDVQPPSASIPSGTTQVLAATVRDNYRNQNRDVTDRYGPKVNWTVVLAPDSGDHMQGERVSPTTGRTTTFYGFRAYNCYLVIATVTDTTNNRIFRDTSRICVTPGREYRVVIEADSVILRAELRDSNPIDRVTMQESDTFTTVAAVVRDSMGAFIRLASRTTTQWRSDDENVATARPHPGIAFVGDIRRVVVGAGTTLGRASEGSLLPDDVIIQVLSGRVLEVRFVDMRTGQVVTAVDIATDDEIQLKMQVRMSTSPDRWEDAAGDWDLNTSTIRYAGAAPPDNGGSWLFSPTTPGTGTLCANSGGVQTCVPVNVTPSPPRRAEMTLLTPDSLRIAGETLLVEVRIYNLDGLVPGTYCFNSAGSQAVYVDPVGPGAGQPAPVVITDQERGTVNQYFSSSNLDSVRQCFVNGVDTVKFVLYNAPRTKEPHQLLVRLGTIPAQTDPFVLKPGPLDHMDLTSDDAGLNPLPDVVQVPEGGAVMFWAQGYDKWNNYRGPEASVWTTTGSLNQPNATARQNLWMAAQQYPNGAEGDLRATSFTVPSVWTSNHVVIQGRLPQITLAETGDTNGNGYLDQIVVHFNQQVDFSAVDMGTLLAAFGVRADEVTLTSWSVVGIVGANGTLDDSVFVLKLGEQQNGYPQTGWTPMVSVSGLAAVSSWTMRSVDRAPPVVWQVFKVIDPDGDKTKHTYIVVMSERVEAAPGSTDWTFTPPDPAALFDVYTWDRAAGQYVLVPSELLAGAGNVVAKDTSLGGQTLGLVRFNLVDGASELYSHHFLNFQTSPAPIVADLSGNVARAENQKVRVVPLGQVLFDPRPIPNPSAPDARATPNLAPGSLNSGHEPGASDKVKSGEWGGFALVFDITVPDASCSRVIRVFRKIYDVAGNLVNGGVCDDLLATYDDVIQGGSTVHIQMHWDAFNSQGKPVAAGVYREIIYLDYACPSLQDQRGVVTYGVRAP